MNEGNGRMLTMKKAEETIGDWGTNWKGLQKKPKRKIWRTYVKRLWNFKDRTLWFGVYEDKGTKLEGDWWISKHWYQRLSGE